MPVPGKIAAALIAWFAVHARPLPWRRTRNPYAIWISEVMLQQTQVQTVIPFWKRWMTEVPDVMTLARSPLSKVLKLWEGLGYYRRAQHLQAAAQVIASQFQGRFPDQFETVLRLPGVGRYTAGAICSIAFEQATPAVDGNVARVLTRLYGIADPVGSTIARTQLWECAQELVQLAKRDHPKRQRPCGSLNQALMELGATICTPRKPECHRCPVRTFCTACRTGQVHEFPRRAKRPRTEKRRVIAFVASRGGRFAVRQRPAGSLGAHLWEFPNLEIGNGKAFQSVEVAELQERAAACLECAPLSIQPLCKFSHSVTRFRIELTAYVASVAKPPGQSSRLKWHRLSHLEKLAFPSAHRRILAALKVRQDLGTSQVNDGNCSRGRRKRSRSPQERGRVRKSSSHIA